MTTAVPNSEYTFGTHEAAVVNAEAQKSSVQRSAKGGALPRVCTFIAAAPLFMDLTGSAAHFSAAAGIQGRSVCPQIKARGDDPPPLPSQTWSAVRAGSTPLVPNYWEQAPPGPDDRLSSVRASVRATVATTGFLGEYVSQAPQPFDLLNFPSQVETPTFSPQGNLMPLQDAAPEIPWNLAPQFFPRALASAAPPAQPLRLQSAGPQIPWDLPSLFSPSADNPQGPTVRSYAVPPAFIDLSGAAWIVPSARTALITGPTVRPWSSAPAFMDLSGWARVWAGAPALPILLPLPQLVGLAEAAGLALTQSSGFVTGSITFAASTQYQLGVIASQSPHWPGFAVQSSPINIVVSSGAPSPTNTPVSQIRVPNLPNTILPPNNALVDERGVIATNWWRFLLNVSNQAMGVNQTEPASVIATGSPFTVTTPAQGTLLVSGGPVTLIEYSKDGVTWYPMGLTNGPLQLVPNDHVRITYANAPALTFFPR